MLRHTFCHLPGVAAGTEQRLWSAGLTTWDHALAGDGTPKTPGRRLPADELRESVRRHGVGDAAWFAERLPAAQSWRLFADFRDQCAYLDIETTGMDARAVVTTIALYDGKTIRTYVRGRNLDAFADDVRAYRLLVTYNGKSFDLPFLRRGLGCALDHAHIDLRHTLASLGVRGGLKACETKLGVTRPGLEEVNGFMAVLLWHDFQRRKDQRSLDTLLAYNVQDTVNLEALMVHAHNAHLDRLGAAPFAAGYRLAPPEGVANPFAPDPDTVARIARGMAFAPRTGG
jgi:uncharacterized protein